MPEKKIYILVKFGGEYEDAWKTNVLSSFDREKIEALAASRGHEVQVQRQHDEEVYQRQIVISEFMHKWRLENPEPEMLAPFDEVPVPRWIGVPGQRQVITDEMRAEKEAAKAENYRRREAAFEAAKPARAAWQERFDAVRAEFIKSKKYTEHDLESSGDETRGYRVDEVPFEE